MKKLEVLQLSGWLEREKDEFNRKIYQDLCERLKHFEIGEFKNEVKGVPLVMKDKGRKEFVMRKGRPGLFFTNFGF